MRVFFFFFFFTSNSQKNFFLLKKCQFMLVFYGWKKLIQTDKLIPVSFLFLKILKKTISIKRPPDASNSLGHKLPQFALLHIFLYDRSNKLAYKRYYSFYIYISNDPAYIRCITREPTSLSRWLMPVEIWTHLKRSHRLLLFGR